LLKLYVGCREGGAAAVSLDHVLKDSKCQGGMQCGMYYRNEEVKLQL